MPIRDHFHPPLLSHPPWRTIHGIWLGRLTANLNRKWLPRGYSAEMETSFGSEVEPDVAVVREPQAVYAPAPGEAEAGYELPPPDARIAGLTAPAARVRVRNADGRLVGALELVSPANKDRPEKRDAFAGKMQDYLASSVALVVVDVVTLYRHNLHNLWVERCSRDASRLPEDDRRPLYVTAYRPYLERTGEQSQPKVDLWLRPLGVGDELPVLPLFIDYDLAVPIELEETYQETCADIRLPDAA